MSRLYSTSYLYSEFYLITSNFFTLSGYSIGLCLATLCHPNWKQKQNFLVIVEFSIAELILAVQIIVLLPILHSYSSQCWASFLNKSTVQIEKFTYIIELLLKLCSFLHDVFLHNKSLWIPNAILYMHFVKLRIEYGLKSTLLER